MAGALSMALLAVTVSGTMTSFNSGEIISASTINANFTALRSAIEGVPDHEAVRVTTSQSVNGATITTLTFTGEDFDTKNLFTPSGTAITVQSDGIYLVSAEVDFASGSANNDVFWINANPGGRLLMDVDKNAPTAGQATHLAGTTVYRLSAGDTVTLDVYQGSGGALVCTAELMLVKLGN